MEISKTCFMSSREIVIPSSSPLRSWIEKKAGNWEAWGPPLSLFLIQQTGHIIHPLILESVTLGWEKNMLVGKEENPALGFQENEFLCSGQKYRHSPVGLDCHMAEEWRKQVCGAACWWVGGPCAASGAQCSPFSPFIQENATCLRIHTKWEACNRHPRY